jgi:hypothetical protein
MRVTTGSRSARVSDGFVIDGGRQVGDHSLAPSIEGCRRSQGSRKLISIAATPNNEADSVVAHLVYRRAYPADLRGAECVHYGVGSRSATFCGWRHHTHVHRYRVNREFALDQDVTGCAGSVSGDALLVRVVPSAGEY